MVVNECFGGVMRFLVLVYKIGKKEEVVIYGAVSMLGCRLDGYMNYNNRWSG